MKVIDEYAMQITIKGMQYFLGAALLFKSHVGNFWDKSDNIHKRYSIGTSAQSFGYRRGVEGNKHSVVKLGR